MTEHVGLAVKDNGVGEEFFVAAEIGAGFEVVDQGADAGKVVRGGELGDDEGEVAAVEGEVRGEGGGAADVEDALRLGLGFEEVEGAAGFLRQG